jgi:hypothetical protein
MTNRLVFVLSLATALSMGACCGSRTPVSPSPVAGRKAGPAAYLPPTEPTAVIANLETAYANRDINAYRQLFAPEFVFRFQSQDACAVGRGSWGLPDELRSARHLFESPEVKRISIRLTMLPPTATREPGLEDTRLVRVSNTYLRIERQGKPPLVVRGDRQEFFLRRAVGRGAVRWLIVEWRDLPPCRPEP